MTTEMEIICVGNELLIGKIVNTNASWLGKHATSLGVWV
jgi:molybdopterin-biosynthesis enzyme MoeA-like protein